MENIRESGNELKSYVDSKLEKRDLLNINSFSEQKPQGKNLIKLIRNSNKKRDIWNNEKTETNYKNLLTELENIEIGNRQIEEKVKMELIGVKDDFIKKVGYQIKNFIDRVKGNEPKKAQDIMKDQLERVDSVAQGLKQASRVMDMRGEKLEKYYDSLTFKLEKGVEYRGDLLESIEEINELMQNTQEIIDDTEEFKDRLKYTSAKRKLRKNIQNKTWEIKLTDKNIDGIKKELPFIDSFEDFCESYSFALKESHQKIQTLKGHLTNVMGLYFEMMRTDHINNSLKQRVGKVLEYTQNMNNSLSGARNLILGVNDNKVFKNEYEKRYDNLEGMMNDVFDSNSKSFHNLESSVTNLLSNPSKNQISDSKFNEKEYLDKDERRYED